MFNAGQCTLKPETLYFQRIYPSIDCTFLCVLCAFVRVLSCRYFLRYIYISPSRQDLCSCRLMTAIHPEQWQAKAIYLFFSRYFSDRLTSSAKPISLRRFLEDKWISIHSFSEKWYPHALASSTICFT